MAENEDILVSVRNGAGVVTLNRPKAINSLNDVMVDGLQKALTTWENDASVRSVLLTGAGERGLCAGGDVVALYHSAKADGSYARKFWWDEYLLNAHIGRYPKPYIALMDGIVMGGGVGVAAHGSVRVVTDKTKMGMPEVGIGFIPDVGGTYLLSRTPGLLGLHAALTGAPFSGADAIAMGFADHFVPHARLHDFAEAVVTDGHEDALNSYAEEPPASELLAQRDWIDTCYARDTVGDIIDDLRRQETEQADAAAHLIGTRSPIALAVTLTSVRRAAHLETLEEVLQQEFRVSVASAKSHDFVEGIRAQLVDKDRNPQWSPATLELCDDAAIDAYFASAHPDLTF
ncbi:3-hydroxyisobutyryl-CoA hydrolase [Mycobacterium sp. Root265]|uniref:enoyl-CoA hydratase/isomerase family protein n=1 Tax=Mycobacterium sp. Root265 TaxID=1736504 RepID=UPI00070E0089|nr:enoyl-CoA hydratase/isomerase family protein [Mycobacterium sp. Root265]KRD19535.1 3-hydroxyisobutyryl-CoA hydrolase [Mycobacterium sp. Root265]